MLNGIEDSINPGAETRFYEATGCLRDGSEALHHCFWMGMQMLDQSTSACQILGLCQRAEDCLEQGSVTAEFRANKAETVQLSREMRSGRVESRQVFPVIWVVDATLG